MAPEIAFQVEEYDDKCDIWSLRVVLYRMFFNSFPISLIDESINELTERLKKFELSLPDCENNSTTQKIYYLLKRMLVVNPIQRISWKELFNTRTYLEGNSKPMEAFKFTKEGKLKKKFKGSQTT